MMKGLFSGLMLVVLVGVLLHACTKTKMTNIWMDEAYQGGPVSDILVIGISHEEKTRRTFENIFVKQLKAAGVEAVSSADVIPMPADQKIKKEAILEAVRKHNNDAVLITHLIGVEEKQVRTPSDSFHTDGYYGYYGHVYGYTHVPDYYNTYTYIRLETTLYGVNTEKPIWSGQSRTLDQDSDKKLFVDVIKTVIENLQRNNLLLKK